MPAFINRENQMRVVGRSKPSKISGLSALLHMKNDSCRSGWIGSATAATTLKAMLTSVMECIRAWTWYVDVLVIYCRYGSHFPSAYKRSSYHRIKTTQAKRVQRFPSINSSRKSLFWKFITDLEAQILCTDFLICIIVFQDVYCTEKTWGATKKQY